MAPYAVEQYETFEHSMADGERVHSRASSYLDVEHIHGKRVLKVTTREFVGFIPLTESASVTVRPKLPIEDIFRMVNLSGKTERRIAATVGVDWQASSHPDLLSFMADDFGRGLDLVQQNGFWKVHEEKRVRTSTVRGKIHFKDTVLGPWMHGLNHVLVSAISDPTVDTAPNRILKSCTLALLRTEGVARPTQRKLRAWERSFRAIPDGRVSEDVHTVARLMAHRKGIPDSREYYRRVLSIAMFVLDHSSVALTAAHPLEMNAFAINMDQVFEGYVRNALAIMLGENGYSVKDGNHHERPLFENSTGYHIRPDILVEDRGRVVAVGDAKYTRGPPKKDDMAQMLSYMSSLGLAKGFLVCPSTPANPSNFLLTTPISEIHVLTVDLRDMLKAESDLAKAVHVVLPRR